MKKLMIAAAIVCAAVAVNASTVSWGIATGALDTEKFGTGSKLYLIAGATPADLSGMKVDTFTIDNILSYASASKAILNTGDNEISLVNGAGVFSGASNGVTSYGDNKTGRYDIYAIAVSGDGKSAAVSTAKFINIAASPAPAQANWAATAFTTYSASAIPEPTSGLLLLLGVAGLALRRRRA